MKSQPVPFVDLASARELLGRLIPEVVGVLDRIEESDGRLKLRGELDTMIEQNALDMYPLLYEKLAQQSVALRAALSSGVDLSIPGTEFSLATPEGRGHFALEMFRELDEVEPALSFPVFPEDHEAAADIVAGLDTEWIGILDRSRSTMTALMLAVFYEYMSMAVHGVRLSKLIAKAVGGDDEAFGKAIQIDGRIQFAIPYFSRRCARARTEADQEFLAMVGRKSSRPQYKGYLTHKHIWLTVGCLDMLGLLPMPGEALLDFCNDVGANNGECPIEDVTNMLKLVANYNRYQI